MLKLTKVEALRSLEQSRRTWLSPPSLRERLAKHAETVFDAVVRNFEYVVLGIAIGAVIGLWL